MAFKRICYFKYFCATFFSKFQTSPNHSMDNSFMSDIMEATSTKETISTTIRRDSNGSPGFSVAGGKGASSGDAIVISSIRAGGAAERDGKLRIGDRVLSVSY